MMRGSSPPSEVTTARKRPRRSRPIVTNLGSSSECSSSHHSILKGSRSATIASSKLTPCCRTFSASLAESRPYSTTPRTLPSAAHPPLTSELAPDDLVHSRSNKGEIAYPVDPRLTSLREPSGSRRGREVSRSRFHRGPRDQRWSRGGHRRDGGPGCSGNASSFE